MIVVPPAHLEFKVNLMLGKAEKNEVRGIKVRVDGSWAIRVERGIGKRVPHSAPQSLEVGCDKLILSLLLPCQTE